MTAHSRPAMYMAAMLAFALGMWGWRGPDWFAAAQSTPKWVAKADPAKTGEADVPLPKGQQGLALVVNGDAITAYDIEQRARLLSLGDKEVLEKLQGLAKAESNQERLKALEREVIANNPGKSREELSAIFEAELRRQAASAALPRLQKEATEQLIEERLKLQAAKKLGIEVSDEDVQRMLKARADAGKGADGQKVTVEQYAQDLKKRVGVDIGTMGELFRAREAWALLIQRQYSPRVSVSQRDIDQVLAAAAVESGDDTVELQVQRIALAATADQRLLTKRYAEGEALGRKFAGCKGMDELVRNVPDAKFEDMKYVKPSKFAEPIRSMLLDAKDGDMLPPFTIGTSVELYAICGRRTTIGNEDQRAKAMQALQFKELSKWAQRLMRDLRQDAVIERVSR